MKCSKYRIHISALLDNQLTGQLQTQVEDHLDVCESCMQFFVQCQNLNIFVSKLESPTVSSNFTQESLLQFKSASTLPSIRHPRYLSLNSLVSLAAAFLVSFYLYSQFQTDTKLNPTPQETAQKIDEYLELAQDLFQIGIPFEESQSMNEVRLLLDELKESQIPQKTNLLLQFANSSDKKISSQFEESFKSLLLRINHLYEDIQQEPPHWRQITIQHQAIVGKVSFLVSKKAPRQKTKTLPFKKNNLNFVASSNEGKALLIGKRFLREKNYPLAIQAFRNFRKKFPSSDFKDRVQFLESVALHKYGRKMASFRLFAKIQDPNYIPAWKIAEYEQEFYENQTFQIWMSAENQNYITQIDDPMLGHVFTKLKSRLLEHYKKQGSQKILFIQSPNKDFNPHSNGAQLLQIVQQYPSMVQIEKTTTPLEQQSEIQITAYKINIKWKEFNSKSSIPQKQFMSYLKQKAPTLFLSH